MSHSPDLDDLLPYLMNRLVSRLNQNLGERLRRRGHSFQEWRVLAVLAAHDGITLSQLAEATVIPQPTVSRLVARLARREFLRRRPGARDARFTEAWITPRGRAAYRRMLPHAIEEYPPRRLRLQQGRSRVAARCGLADARQYWRRAARHTDWSWPPPR